MTITPKITEDAHICEGMGGYLWPRGVFRFLLAQGWKAGKEKAPEPKPLDKDSARANKIRKEANPIRITSYFNQ